MSVKQYLQDHRVRFKVVPHTEVFDASHLAQATHTPGHEVAKTVLVRANHGYGYVVCVLPATHAIDMQRLSQALGGAAVELASEDEVAKCCPDCEYGVLPPFGSHYAAKTVVDVSLTKDEEIVFEGETHSEAIRMKYEDYYGIEHPMVADFARPVNSD